MNDIIFNNISLYRKLTTDNYNQYIELSCKLTKNFINDADSDFEDIQKKLNEHSICIIVFSTMAIECFINDYIIRFKSKSCLARLDKMSLMNKIITAIKLVTNIEYSREYPGYVALKKLIRSRNRIVHSKPVKIEIPLGQEAFNKNFINAVNKSYIKNKYGEFLLSDIEDFISTFDLLLHDIKGFMGNEKLQYLNEVSELERVINIAKKICTVGIGNNTY